MRQERAHISLNSRTKEALDLIRAPGQSYDGVIQQLIKLWDKQSELDRVNGRQSIKRNTERRTWL
jgi:hypothetical protein